MQRIIIGNCFEMWLVKQWENLIGPFPLLLPSPPEYFDIKAKLEYEKALEHLENYEEFQARMRAHNRLNDGPIICHEMYWR